MTSAFRACTPGETYQRVSPFLQRLGITRVACQTGLDRIGVPVWCAYTPNAKSIVIAQGKGSTDEVARTSAVMEAVERAVATEPHCTTRHSSADLLRHDDVEFDPLDMLLAAGSTPIGPQESVEWAEAFRVGTAEPILIPHEAIHLDHTRDKPRFWLSSDGLASGNSLAEAVLHGLLERIERDALTLWDVTDPSRRHTRRILPETMADEGIQALLRKIDVCDLDIALYDITTDIDVACVAALLGPRRLTADDIRHVDVTLGAGAALDPTIAAERAITEAIQSRMTFIAGARDDLLASTFTRTLDQSTRLALQARPRHDFRALPSISAATAEGATQVLIQKLAAQSVSDVYAVDLTPPWLPVSVAKVIVPQLEHPEGLRRQRFGMRALSRSIA